LSTDQRGVRAAAVAAADAAITALHNVLQMILCCTLVYSPFVVLVRSYFYMKDAFCCEFVVMLYWMAASSVAIGELLQTVCSV
jgi:hypothetical protein